MKLTRALAIIGLIFAALFGLAAFPIAGMQPAHAQRVTRGKPTETISRHKNWHVRWKVAKWRSSASYRAGRKPDAVVIRNENLLLNGGITELLKLLCGTGGTPYSNANAYIKVGNSTTAAAAAQTDMQGASTDQAAMDATYPQVSGQTATWKSTFGTSAANFAWEEVGVKNGSGAVSSSILMLNRKVSSFGTKTAGSTWTMTVTLTVS